MAEEIKRRVLEQLLAVRDTGETNMLDIHTVQVIADRMGFSELVAFIDQCPTAYRNAIFTGKLPWEKEEEANG